MLGRHSGTVLSSYPIGSPKGDKLVRGCNFYTPILPIRSFYFSFPQSQSRATYKEQNTSFRLVRSEFRIKEKHSFVFGSSGRSIAGNIWWLPSALGTLLSGRTCCWVGLVNLCRVRLLFAFSPWLILNDDNDLCGCVCVCVCISVCE